MNIEEQLRELAESDRRIQARHEALAQSMELFVSTLREHERTISEQFQDTDQQFRQIARNFEIVHDSIRRLENIAVAHEQRLDDLEG